MEYRIYIYGILIRISNMPHFSFIFRKLDTFRKELNNDTYSRLGTMLYLREKKWKESTKMAEFKQDIGGMES